MIYPDEKTIKKQARIMCDFLKAANDKISLSACYNCIAKMWGFENWNQFSTILKEIENEIIE